MTVGRAETAERDGRWLAFVPRDTVTVRDGRSFDAGADVTSESVWPWPSSIAGAVRAAYGAEPQEVRGPVLARRTARGWRPYFPMPADVAEDENNPEQGFLLRPDPDLQVVVTDLEESMAALLAAPRGRAVRQASGWLSADRLESYLRGDLPVGGFALTGLRDGGEPVVPEIRIGLARTRGRIAREGYLYQMTHLRLRDDWAFLAHCLRPAGHPRGPVQLGGRGRMVDVEPAPEAAWPQPPETYPGGRVLVYVATPSLWATGWRLPPVGGARLVGAAVPAPLPVSTASPYLAREQNRTFRQTAALRWAVPAGAVYLLDFGDAERARNWAHAHHGQALGPALGASAQQDRLRTAGFGIVLAGTWKDE